MTVSTLPRQQYAVQLIGPGQLVLNRAKPLPAPGPYEVVLRVEAAGLCFSDLKLLKQFDAHARKGPIVGGIDPQILQQMHSYVPGTMPTVPGHEVVGRIVAVGEKVRHHRVGERCLVQTDYRELPTAGSNAAFGYNFEGGLQEYVLMDERVIVDSHGQRFLLPVGEERSASAVALVEPWACVEDAYVTPERRAIKAGGRLLVVCPEGRLPPALAERIEQAYATEGPPAQRLVVGPEQIDSLPSEHFDDIVYLGADAAMIEALNGKLAPGGLMNLVLGGQSIGRPVKVGVGRVHYGGTRWIGTPGSDPTESYRRIPATGELRTGERMLVVGAGGPMGQMHVLRALASGLSGLRIVGTDVDDQRLAALRHKAEPLARSSGAELHLINTRTTPLEGRFTYIVLLVPAGELVAAAVEQAEPGAIINLFAGIPAATQQALNLDAYIQRGCYMIGTSGSTVRDMQIVLEKVEAGRLDTNLSVDAVSGLGGAIEGMAAIENRTLAGKIVVYPALRELGLIPLSRLAEVFPSVAAKLDHGRWTAEAEKELLRVAGGTV